MLPLLAIWLLLTVFVLEPILLLKRLATAGPSEAWRGVDLGIRQIWTNAIVIAAFVTVVYVLGLGWVGGVIAFFALLALCWLVGFIRIARARALKFTALSGVLALVIAFGLLGAGAAIPGNVGVALVLSSFVFLAVAARLAFRLRRQKPK